MCCGDCVLTVSAPAPPCCATGSRADRCRTATSRTALCTSSRLDVAKSDSSCWASPSHVVGHERRRSEHDESGYQGAYESDESAAKPHSLVRPGPLGLGPWASPSLLANPPVNRHRHRWLPLLVGVTWARGSRSWGRFARSGSTLVAVVSHEPSDDLSSTSTRCSSSPTLASALTGDDPVHHPSRSARR